MGIAEVVETLLARGRLEKALANQDFRTVTVLTLHAAIEQELDQALIRNLANAARLAKIPFGQKVSIWAATLPLADGLVSEMVEPIKIFNDLRNAVAHGDRRAEVDALIRKLNDAVGIDIPPEQDGLELAAIFVVGLLVAPHLAAAIANAAASDRKGRAKGRTPRAAAPKRGPHIA